MILLRTLTPAFFATQQLNGIDHNAMSSGLYVKQDNLCVQTGQLYLTIQYLPQPGKADNLLRSYEIGFNGRHNSNTKQVQVLNNFGWNLARLTEHLDQQYRLALRYQQVAAPATETISLFLVTYPSKGRAHDLKISVRVKHTPSEEVFTPFLNTSTASIGRPTASTSRAATIQGIKNKRLQVLPNALTDSLHILDRVGIADLAYPLEQLELLATLVQDTTWSATKLPGNIVHVTGLSLPLFFQAVKPSRSHVKPTGELMLRQAMRIRKAA